MVVTASSPSVGGRLAMPLAAKWLRLHRQGILPNGVLLVRMGPGQPWILHEDSGWVRELRRETSMSVHDKGCGGENGVLGLTPLGI